jgi:hypothetical protein
MNNSTRELAQRWDAFRASRLPGYVVEVLRVGHYSESAGQMHFHDCRSTV